MRQNRRMYRAKFNKLTLNFKQPGGTSRGVLNDKDSWILQIWEDSVPHIKGTGEASIIKGLSPDWSNTYTEMLESVASNINEYILNPEKLHDFPSIRFAVETALLDLANGGQKIIFENDRKKIPINGLIWMGSKDFMLNQIEEKLNEGFTCIKMKIGAIDFNTELAILKHIRNRFSSKEITIRVDANGAFSADNAKDKLFQLSKYEIHSIEQPIKEGQWDEMAALCADTPVPIALDEELIGISSYEQKEELLENINPQYIILKPSLIGGLKATDEWIQLAESKAMQWWITSALESNVGLNAIAQYTATKNITLPQGLGTGSVYTNNISPFLKVKEGFLFL